MTKENLKKVPEAINEDKPEEELKGVVKQTVDTGEYTAEITKDYYGNIDPFYLSKKDPKYEYRFLRDEMKNLSIKTGNLLFQKGAWKICSREHLKRLGIEERFISPDGMLRRGDTILAFMPKELYAEKREHKQTRANAPVKAIKRLLEKGDRNIGGKDIHDSMKGVQTKEELKM